MEYCAQIELKKPARLMSKLKIAIPSKGRLKDESSKWLEECGFKLRQHGGERGYRAHLEEIEADVMFLSAQEIANGLIEGKIHLGVTGQDLLHESSNAVDDQFTDFSYRTNDEPVVKVLQLLNFGHSNVVLAVPRAWIDVTTISDFEEVSAQFPANYGERIRVATKYVSLTRAFFEAHGIATYRIVESVGATEAAPASGTADAIVDITSTGETIKANGLKILEDSLILKSQAVLAKSRTAEWTNEAKYTFESFINAVP